MKRFPWMIAGFWLASGFAASGFVAAVNSSGNTLRWNLLTPQSGVSTNVVNTNTHAIRYFLASDGFSTTNTAAELNAIRAAFAQWQAVSNTYIKFEDAGLVAPQSSINTSDNTNVIFWAKNSTLVGGGNDISGALGVTFKSFSSPGNVILQGDIALNGVEFNWFTDYFDTNNFTDTFTEAVALHEIGHLLGLLHSPLGAATMLWVGSPGINLQTGLNSDDVAGARHLYPTAAASYGAIRGNLTKGGSPVYGAAVFVRDAASNTVAGTVSDASGNYLLSSLSPGTYQVRVAPLDDAAAADFLVRGRDISASTANNFSSADTTFLPTTNKSTTVTANLTNVLDFTLVAGTPAFRITFIRVPTTISGAYSISGVPTSLRAGQSNYFIGVFSDSLPTSGATFTITGDGLTLGSPTYNNVFAGLNGISMSISVSSNATPGARDIIVTQGANVAYASGFFEVQGTNTDFNFDGLEDTFQRKYFPLFTATNAAPGADPDNDGLNNAAEYIAGTVPTNSASVLKMLRLDHANSTTTAHWLSVPGKQYQLSYRTNLTTGGWVNVGGLVTAAGTNASQTDTTATSVFRGYRIQVLP